MVETFEASAPASASPTVAPLWASMGRGVSCGAAEGSPPPSGRGVAAGDAALSAGLSHSDHVHASATAITISASASR